LQLGHIEAQLIGQNGVVHIEAILASM
jgi:hypothetical protein